MDELTPITRQETFLAAAAGQGVTPPNPVTRKEMLYKNIIDKQNGDSPSYSVEPVTREEMFLKAVEESAGGGGTITLQDKTVTPSASEQTVEADDGYDGLRAVIVNGDADLVAGNIKKNVDIFGVTGTYEGASSLGEFSQYDYVDVQTADQTTLTVTNPLGVEPKLVTVEALTNPDPTSSNLWRAWYTPYGGSIQRFNGAYLSFAEPICNRTDTLDSNQRSYVMDQNSLQAHRYNALYNWDLSVTYRVRFYA